MIIFIIFFQIQYNSLYVEGKNLHLVSVAENQANMFDLYLRERISNLQNISYLNKEKIADINLDDVLFELKSKNPVFIDIGFLNFNGKYIDYSGPLTDIRKLDYSVEDWFRKLNSFEFDYIITDIYLGLRNNPHFTIAVKKKINNSNVIIKASLEPTKMFDYMQSVENSKEVLLGIINADNNIQVASEKLNATFDGTNFKADTLNQSGFVEGTINNEEVFFGYAKMNQVDWTSIVLYNTEKIGQTWWINNSMFYIFPFVILFITITTVLIRSKAMVKMEREKDIVRNQLVQASKLASVGELASGIAHEINNPLAIIGSESGLIYDMIDPEYGINASNEDIIPHLKKIDNAVYRCRDITRKLLSFVRQTDFKLELININELLEELFDGFFDREMSVSNIRFEKNYQIDLPTILLDGNQFKQVALNLVNNAVDAITPPGVISVSTFTEDAHVCLSISDTGKGIELEEIEKIFMPFYTTKEVGKGTGLGLSVSYGIVKSFGGDISVESIPDKGTTFKVILPLKQ